MKSSSCDTVKFQFETPVGRKENRMKLERKEISKWIYNILLTVLGTLLLAFGTAVFILPFDLVAGGVSGIAIVIDAIIPFEAVSVELIVTVLTWGLFIAGFFILGKGFALKTLISSVVYPVGVALFGKLVSPDVLNGFFCLTTSEYGETVLLLASVFGGVCVGAGCAVTFLGGGSTGGVDIIAFSICKIFPRAKSSVIIFIIDAVVIAGGMFVIGDLVISLLGILSAFISAVVVDKVFLGGTRSFVAQVVTDRSQEITEEIIRRIERTTTVIEAVGGYSGKEKKLVLISFTMNQYAEVMSIINRHDPSAFVTIHSAHEISGEGWTR